MNRTKNMSTLVEIAIPLGLLLICIALYLPAGASLGLWEPWETAPATLARRLVMRSADLSPFALIGDEGLISRPWLQTVLLKLGYMLGNGSEAGLRLPMAMVTMISALGSYGCLRLLYSAARSGLVVLAFVVSPMILLSAMSLAGYSFAHAPLTLTLVAMATVSSRPGRWSTVLVPLIGVGLGFSVWGLGLLGWAVPIGVLALFAMGARGSQANLPVTLGFRAAGMVTLLALVLWPLMRTYFVGLDASIAAPLAEGEAARTFLETWSLGWIATKDAVGACVAIGLPLGALLFALPGSRADWLLKPVHGLLAVAAFAIVVVPPAVALYETAALLNLPPLETTLTNMLYTTLFEDRTYPSHVTFAVIVRVVAFASFPLVCLVPFGFGYLLHAGEGDTDVAPPDTAFRMFMALWLGVGFGVFGLAATLTNNFAFSMVFPMSAAVVLALTDREFIRRLRVNRIAFYAAGLGSFFILAVMTKDIRGQLDSEAGQAGPLVVYELLLADGSETFPSSYVLQSITSFVVAWFLILLAFFSRPLSNVAILGAWLETLESHSKKNGPMSALVDAVVVNARILGTMVHQAGRFMIAGWQGLPVIGRVAPGFLAIVVFVGVNTVWALHLSTFDVPEMTEHFSQKNVLTTYDEYASEGDPLYVVGVAENDNSYYLAGDTIEQVPSMDRLRTLFCEAGESRVFAIVPTPRLSEAWFQVRRPRGETQDEECPPQELSVLYGRSSRYALISNQLHPEDGEVHEGFIAENVITDNVLPEGVTEVPAGELTVGGHLELAGYRVTPEEIGHGPVEIESFWRVLTPPPSGYKAFIHVDYDGNRINGDHDLVDGNMPLNHWVVGDIVRDKYTIEVSRADKSGDYIVLFGFWRGDDRLDAEGERATSDNRIRLGTLRVRR
jgi:hypothetical protein